MQMIIGICLVSALGFATAQPPGLQHAARAPRYDILPSMPDMSQFSRNFQPIRAKASLNGTSGVRGVVLFEQVLGGKVRLTGNVTGLVPRSTHGFHIHQFGDMSNGCTSMGDHFNPFNRTHGSPSSPMRHVGDLGNIVADDRGVVALNLDDSMVTLDGPVSVIGRGIVIHEREDDLGTTQGNPQSLATGNAGGRIACGIIGVSL